METINMAIHFLSRTSCSTWCVSETFFFCSFKCLFVSPLLPLAMKAEERRDLKLSTST